MPAWVLPAIQGGVAAAGGLTSLLGKKKPASTQQLQRFSPEQQSALSQLLQQGMQNTNPEAIQKQAMNRFTSETAPSIASRFASMGGAGAQRSSAFPASLAGAGAEMQGNIAAMMPQLGLQQLMMGLQPQFDTMRQGPQQGMMQGMGEGLFSSGMQGLGNSLGSMFGEKDSLAQLLDFLKQQQKLGSSSSSGSTGSQGTASPLYEEKVNPVPSMPQPAYGDGGMSQLLAMLQPRGSSNFMGGY